MKTAFQHVLVETLDYLMTLSQKGTQPEEAKAGLRHLQKQYPDTKLELLWEREEYDRSLHYDVLLRLREQGTVSLSFCPERVLPWPLRGVHRWSEKDLVRVNNTILEAGQAIACLDFIWDEARIVNHLINMCLIQEELEQHPIELSDADLQLVIDRFRQVRKLYTAEDTYRWLEQNGLTHEQLEQMLIDQVLVAKLCDKLTANHVDNYFAAHQADFDTAYIAQLQFSDRESAYQIYEQICLGKVNFHEAAKYCLQSMNPLEQRLRPLFEVVQRRQMHPELRLPVFAMTEPDAILQPLLIEDSYTIVQVLSLSPAHLNESTREIIKKLLFDEWLTQQRRTAKIEWYWGIANHTSQYIQQS